MKKNIYILNHYASNMYCEKGGRHYALAKYLKRSGYEPVIFCANSKHGIKENFFENQSLWHEHFAEEIDVPFIFVKTQTYSNNGKDRVKSMIDFYFNVKKVCKQYAESNNKPDVIYASSVHPLTLVAGIQLAKKFGVKCVCEIRDLWPESIVAYGVAQKSNLAVRLLYQLEKWIYKKSDAIIFTMEGGKDYIIEKGWDKSHGGPIDLNKVHHINNGVDLEVFDYNKEHYKVDDPDLDDPNTFKVVYTGSIRRVNNLKQIVDVAEILSKSNNDKIKFLIFGDGNEREQLEKEVSQKHLDNIVFKGRIKKEQIPYVLSKADLCLFHWQSTPLIKYGASGNKSFEYLATGKPILSNSVTGYDLIEKYQCGISKNIKSAEEYAKSIVEISNLPKEDRIIYGENARNAAENYDFKKLTNDLIELINNRID